MTKDITAEHVLNDLRYLTLLARSFPTVADASTEIIQPGGHPEPAERDGAFPVRHPRRAPGFQPCAEKCLRCDQAQSERDIQQHAARLREEGALHADLLSGTKTGTDPATRKRPGRLVSDHTEPTGTRLPERLVQIHALESAQGPAEGVLLHHPGTAPRVERRARTSPPMWTRSSTRSFRPAGQ